MDTKATTPSAALSIHVDTASTNNNNYNGINDDESSSSSNAGNYSLSLTQSWQRSGKLEQILDRRGDEEYKLLEQAFDRLVQQRATTTIEDDSTTTISSSESKPPEVIFLTSSEAGLGRRTLMRQFEQHVVEQQGGFWISVD